MTEIILTFTIATPDKGQAEVHMSFFLSAHFFLRFIFCCPAAPSQPHPADL